MKLIDEKYLLVIRYLRSQHGAGLEVAIGIGGNNSNNTEHKGGAVAR